MMLRRSYFVSIFPAFIAAWLGWAAIGGHLGFSRKAYAGVEQRYVSTTLRHSSFEFSEV